MVKKQFPSDKQDQFMIRFPDGMRDRIKAAADANNRSMNAEIVATLEDAYPAPQLDDFTSEFSQFQLQWCAGEWKPVDFASWRRFLGGEAIPDIVNRMTSTNNYFVIGIMDVDDGLIILRCNNFRLKNGKVVSTTDDYISEEEKAEYAEIWKKPHTTEKDKARIKFIQDKMTLALRIPAEAASKLIDHLKPLASNEVIEKLVKRISASP